MAAAMSEEETWHPRHLIIGVSIFLEILGVGSFALRIWARKLSKATFWWDDYVMAAGLVNWIHPLQRPRGY